MPNVLRQSQRRDSSEAANAVAAKQIVKCLTWSEPPADVAAARLVPQRAPRRLPRTSSMAVGLDEL